MIYPQKGSQLTPCAEQHNLQTGRAQSQNIGYLAVGVALSVGQPQQRAFARFQLRHGPREIGAALGGAGMVLAGNTLDVFTHKESGTKHIAPADIPREIGGDAIERVAPVFFAVMHRKENLTNVSSQVEQHDEAHA